MAAAIETGVSLGTFNTFGVEARAAFFASVRDVEQLRDALADPRVAGLPRLILGGGSNILFTRDFDGLVVKIDIPGYARIGDDGARWLVRVGAGESWHGTVARLLDDGLPGLENLALIPGSVGWCPDPEHRRVRARTGRAPAGRRGLRSGERSAGIPRRRRLPLRLPGQRLQARARRRARRRRRHPGPAEAVDRRRGLRRRRERTEGARHRPAGGARPVRRRRRDPPAETARPGAGGQRRQLLQESGGAPRAARRTDRPVPVAGQLRHRGRSLQARGGLADRGLRPEGCRSRPRGSLPPPGPRAGQPRGRHRRGNSRAGARGAGRRAGALRHRTRTRTESSSEKKRARVQRTRVCEVSAVVSARRPESSDPGRRNLEERRRRRRSGL